MNRVPKKVATFHDFPAPHILESETVDHSNESLAFTLFAHVDPDLVTVTLQPGWQVTRSRAAIRSMFEQILDGLSTLPAQEPLPPDLNKDAAP